MFAPDRLKDARVGRPAGAVESGPPDFDADSNIMSAVRRALRSVQDQVNEALEEARKAQSDTEREMRARYERTVRQVEEPPKTEEKTDDKKRKVEDTKRK